MLFGVGISLGTALLQTKAATWLANLVVTAFGLNQLGALAILAVLAAFLIVIHLGFASATALAASMIPIVIAVLQKVQTPGISVIGMTMVLQFVVSFGFVLPVNSPQGMVAYGTETFTARDFIRTGLVLTVLAYAADAGVRRDLLALAGLRVRQDPCTSDAAQQAPKSLRVLRANGIAAVQRRVAQAREPAPLGAAPATLPAVNRGAGGQV